MKKTLIYVMLGCAAMLWGMSFIITKELFNTTPDLTTLHITTFRMLLASAVMVPSLALMRKLERIRKEDLKWFLLVSFAEPFAYSFLETSGVQLVDGSLASVIVATIPLFVPFGMAAAYNEKIKLTTLIGIVLSLVGIAVMLMGSNGGFHTAGNWTFARGIIFLSGAVAIAVVYTLLLVKVVNKYRPVTITTYQNLISLIYFLPVMLLCDGSKLPAIAASPHLLKIILLILVLGFFCSTIAYVFYNYGIRSIGASASCIFTNTIPVFSMIAALAIGQEQFVWGKILGMAIVITGVITAQLKSSEKQPAS